MQPEMSGCRSHVEVTVLSRWTSPAMVERAGPGNDRHRTKIMAKKATTKSTKVDAATTVKFAKGAFYEDAKGNLWHCFNAKPKKTPDGHMVVQMQKTEDGVQVGEPGEEYVDSFVKQLTKAELK